MRMFEKYPWTWKQARKGKDRFETTIHGFGSGYAINCVVFMPKIHSHWPIGDPLAKSLAENMPSWLVLNPQPITVLICSLFGRENGHVLLMCSSLSTAQLDSHRQTQQPLASSEASLGGNDFQMA